MITYTLYTKRRGYHWCFLKEGSEIYQVLLTYSKNLIKAKASPRSAPRCVILFVCDHLLGLSQKTNFLAIQWPDVSPLCRIGPERT